MYCSYNESLNREGRNDFAHGGKKLFSSFIRKFTNGITNHTNDKLNRTSTCCFSASIPTREINHWVRIIKGSLI
jgi:hypothetical protein